MAFYEDVEARSRALEQGLEEDPDSFSAVAGGKGLPAGAVEPPACLRRKPTTDPATLGLDDGEIHQIKE